jgi:hypothetical protein
MKQLYLSNNNVIFGFIKTYIPNYYLSNLILYLNNRPRSPSDVAWWLLGFIKTHILNYYLSEMQG